MQRLALLGARDGGDGLEAAHHGGRVRTAFSEEPYRQDDRNDAEAIAIAAREANMRFVAVKSVEQQARLAHHRMREGWKEERTALGNRIRGLLAEFGVVIPKSQAALGRALAEALHDERLPESVRELVRNAREHLEVLGKRIAECDRAIGLSCRADPATKRLQELCGVGPTSADAAVATVGDARAFKNGRQFAAWVGLTPRQFSSGGTTRLGGITRRGECVPEDAPGPGRSVRTEERLAMRSGAREPVAAMDRAVAWPRGLPEDPHRHRQPAAEEPG